jgi:outer membrane protein assembly factor BamB
LLIEGTLYGVNGNHKNSGTDLYARDFSTGAEKWSVPNYGYASMIAVGETLVILTEDGDLVTAPVDADEYTEISRKKLLDAICWTNPTYVGGRLYVRNEHGKLIVLERV